MDVQKQNYAENFGPVMPEDEYIREGFYQMDHPVREDVLREQEKINRSDIIVFIYPDFWTASPAMLEGWFQRVWTYGFAYGSAPTMKTLEKAMFLVYFRPNQMRIDDMGRGKQLLFVNFLPKAI